MTKLVISAEGAYSDVEHDFIENEPPGLFPQDQRSIWGQVRATYAAYLQVLANLLTDWYGNLDPATVGNSDLPEWEYMLDLPSGNLLLTDGKRRAAIQARFQRGPFTRTRRKAVVESFISVTFGDPSLFTSAGLSLSPYITMYSGVTNVSSAYEIIEDIPNFAYTVYVLSSVGIDSVGLTRELGRITPAGISFTISQVSTLP